jgi:hypothetical protein
MHADKSSFVSVTPIWAMAPLPADSVQCVHQQNRNAILPPIHGFKLASVTHRRRPKNQYQTRFTDAGLSKLSKIQITKFQNEFRVSFKYSYERNDTSNPTPGWPLHALCQGQGNHLQSQLMCRDQCSGLYYTLNFNCSCS